MEVRTLIHDLNNALTTILGHAEWLVGEDADPATLRKDLEAIRQSAHHAARLARELRTWVREAGVAGASVEPELQAAPIPFRAMGLRIVEPPAVPRSARRILLVDDQEDVRQSVADMLSALGHEVTTASTGQEALASLAENAVDLVFTDFSMPDMDGLALAEAARRVNPEVPVVLLTGWGTELEETHEQVRLVLSKPVTLGTLRDAVDQIAA
ncbi:MAG: response regulator [Vicinamibacterales bacterium]